MAVISGDVVASTSLNDAGRDMVTVSLEELFVILKEKFNVYGRIIKGDYIECVIPAAEHALLIALCIKSKVKSLSVYNLAVKESKRYENFKTYGIKLAIGYGELSRFDSKQGIIDGEAIYLSGRKMNELTTYGKERIIIKNTLFFVSSNENLNIEFDAFFSLLDQIINKATAKQCLILNFKLLGYTEEEIAKELNVSQSVINQHSTAIGWNAIEKAINYFSFRLKS